MLKCKNKKNIYDWCLLTAGDLHTLLMYKIRWNVSMSIDGKVELTHISLCWGTEQLPYPLLLACTLVGSRISFLCHIFHFMIARMFSFETWTLLLWSHLFLIDAALLKYARPPVKKTSYGLEHIFIWS